jgi:hypothetical protein
MVPRDGWPLVRAQKALITANETFDNFKIRRSQ